MALTVKRICDLVKRYRNDTVSPGEKIYGLLVQKKKGGDGFEFYEGWLVWDGEKWRPEKVIKS